VEGSEGLELMTLHSPPWQRRGGRAVNEISPKASSARRGRGGSLRNQHSPIANLEHPSALSLAISRAAKLLIRLIVEGCSRLAIGECWLRIFGPSSSGAICCAKPS